MKRNCINFVSFNSLFVIYYTNYVLLYSAYVFDPTKRYM